MSISQANFIFSIQLIRMIHNLDLAITIYPLVIHLCVLTLNLNYKILRYVDLVTLKSLRKT